MRFVAIGSAHPHMEAMVRGLRALAGVELVGLADRNAERLAAWQAGVGVPAWADHMAMLADVRPDFAAVCPANSEKAGVIADCAAQGVHVLADKPLVTRRTELEKVEAALRESAVEVWACFELRYQAPFVAMRELIAAGEIGEVVSLHATLPHRLRSLPRTAEMLDSERNGGLLVDLGCHNMDLARWLTGREPVEITATMSNRRFTDLPRFYDNAQVFCRFEGGIAVYLEQSWLHPDASRLSGDCCTAAGTEGTLEYRASDGLLTLTTFARGDETITPDPSPVGLLEDFVRALRGEGTGNLSTVETLASTRATLIAHESAVT